MGRKKLRNDEHTDGIIGPAVNFLGPVDDGCVITYETTPGCWGPMISPTIKGGHEVNSPVAVDGAEIGDSILVKLKSVRIKSRATASGVDQRIEQRWGEGFVKKCAACGTEWPEAKVKGIGLESIKCLKCGASASPFRMVH